jgi:hypothetical protein
VDSLEDHIDEVSNEIKIDRHKDTVEYRWWGVTQALTLWRFLLQL